MLVLDVHVGLSLTETSGSTNLGGASGSTVLSTLIGAPGNAIITTLGGAAALDIVAFTNFPNMISNFLNAVIFSSQILTGDTSAGFSNAVIRSFGGVHSWDSYHLRKKLHSVTSFYPLVFVIYTRYH